MNDTVARIVDIMFQNTEMTEEVAALRDEVMNNCQERYYDLLSRGMSEDAAVGAVLESLKGMEEVIDQYPKKNAYSAPEATYSADDIEGEAEAAGQFSVYAFTADSIRAIDLVLVNENVNIEASEDDLIHVEINSDATEHYIDVSDEGGVLRIRRDERRMKGGAARNPKANSHIELDLDDFKATDFDTSWKNVDSFEKLGMKLGQMFRNLKIKIDIGAEGVNLRIPQGFAAPISLLTTSGDMHINDLACKSLRAVSTSGDIEINAGEDAPMDSAEIVTTSGDIDANAFVQSLNVRAVSGDVDVEGRIQRLSVTSVSGDIEVRADVADCTFKSISGDVDLTFDSDELRNVNGSTVSGDIDIDLPSGIGCIAINTRTRSGDVITTHATRTYGPTVNGSVSSLSGDISIR